VIILKANKVNLFVRIFCFVCFLLPFTELFRHTTYTLCVETVCHIAYEYGTVSEW
jgi:hypothetical protein